MTYSINHGYGQLLAHQIAAAVGPIFGRINVVVPSGDTATKDMLSQIFVPDPDGRVRYFATYEAAYDAVTTNADEVILLAGYSVHAVATGVALSKSRVHTIGMDGGGRLQSQGARIQLSGAVDSAYVVRNTGTRNTFKNIKFIQASTHANAIHCFEDGGEGTNFENCSFTFGVADNLNLTTGSEFVCGTDTGTFTNCTFGAATLTTSGARTVFQIAAVTGGAAQMRDCILRRCVFTIESSSATSQFVKMAASSSLKGINLFDDCTFIASLVNGGGIALTRAVSTANGLTDGILAFAYPRAFNCTDFGTNGTNNDNLQVVAPLNVATDIVGVAPVAT